jgi:hypothetical protein
MKVEYGEAVARSLRAAPVAVRKAFFKQIGFLSHDLHHPSLRAKKYDESDDRWRFYFRIVGDTYRILKLIPHPK